MAEYIDRDALKDRMAGHVPPHIDESNQAYVDGLTDAYTLICQAPAADVVERKTGVWIGEGDGYADGVMVYDIWSCGCCGTRFDEWEEEPDWKYCPRCGSYNGGDDDV